jgi:hypothetical protein
MEIKMGNSHLLSSKQPAVYGVREVDYQSRPIETISSSTLHHKVSKKTEVKLTAHEHKWLKVIYKDYNRIKPGWLRRQFTINQFRRKELKLILTDAGVDGHYCIFAAGDDDFASHLHKTWHLITSGKRGCSYGRK